MKYEIYRGEALPGTCQLFLDYYNGNIDCFRDDQCYAPVGEATCQNLMCQCPAGVNCECGPLQPLRCEGSVRVTATHDEGCNVIEERFDCSEIGAQCDPSQHDCVATQPPPDAGVGRDAAGPPPPPPDAGAPDSGAAQCTMPEDCPELPPPQPGSCYVRRCVQGACMPELLSGPGC